MTAQEGTNHGAYHACEQTTETDEARAALLVLSTAVGLLPALPALATPGNDDYVNARVIDSLPFAETRGQSVHLPVVEGRLRIGGQADELADVR